MRASRYAILLLAALAARAQDESAWEIKPAKRQRADAPPGKRWALLIGIDKYEEMPHLDYCGRDMVELRKVLEKNGGYEPQRIHVLTDADKESKTPTRNRILIALRLFLQQAAPEDTVLVAFSGHGQTKSGKSFLMSIDSSAAPEMLADTALPIEKFHEYLQKCPARQKVLIVDACHSGGARSGEAAVRLDPDALPPARGVLELFSCEVDQVSLEDADLKQGVFSYFLARGLEGEADLKQQGNKDGAVSADELYQFVHERVTRYVAKQGGKQTPKRRGEATGTIILSSRKADGARPGLSPERIRVRLDELGRQQKLRRPLVAAAREWLELPREFGPAREMHILLSLLAQELVSLPQFDVLSRRIVAPLESHRTAHGTASGRRVRAVIVGINKYDDLPSFRGSVNEAKLFADVVSKQARGDVTVLLDAEATPKNFDAALKRAIEPSKRGDVLLILFAGHGNRVRATSGPNPVEGVWILHGRTRRQPTAADVRLVALERKLEKCPAHVIILSFAALASLEDEWPDIAEDPVFRDEMFGRGATAPRAARVFVGPPKGRVLYETSEKGMTRLAMILAKGLVGEADLKSPRLFVPRYRGQRSRVGQPDGFVTLRELVRFTRESFAFDQKKQESERIVVLGHLGSGDVVLTRSELAVD